jgi:S1-C subfamily serine protease
MYTLSRRCIYVKVKQNIISFLLGMLVMLPVGTYATTQIMANAVDVPIYVDGQKVETTTYNIANKNYTSVRDVAEAMGGTVEWKNGEVQISTIKEGTLQDVAKQADNCVHIAMMKDTTQKATASGILWGEDYILTNRHVIEQFEVNKWIAEGNKDIFDRYYCTETETFDTQADIALIKTDRPHGGNIKIGDSSKVKVGDRVVVISSPRGIKNVVTDGEVTKLYSNNLVDYICTNVETKPGSSGGGIFNMQGELIGLMVGGPDAEDEKISIGVATNSIQEIIK